MHSLWGSTISENRQIGLCSAGNPVHSNLVTKSLQRTNFPSTCFKKQNKECGGILL